MTDGAPLEDRAVGVELQLNELVEQRARAVVQGDAVRAARLEAQIGALQDELADTAEHLADPGRSSAAVPPPEPDPTFRRL